MVAALFGLYHLVNARTFQFFAPLVARVPVQERLIALTLDDGPTPEGTEVLLPLLERHGVRATFFVNGEPLRRFPEAGRRIVAAGHQLGNHSDTHPRMLLRSTSFIRRELDATDAAIRAAGFRGEILFRPPFGKKLFGLPWVLRDTGRLTVMWDIEPESTRGVEQTPEGMATHVVAVARPGSILIMHAMNDGTGFKVRALDAIITALRAAGYEFVRMDELLRAGGLR